MDQNKIEQLNSDQIKANWWKTFIFNYQTLSNTVRTLPIPQHLQTIILQKFDEGYLWTKEAFAMIEFKPQPIPEPAPQEAKQEVIVEDDAA